MDTGAWLLIALATSAIAILVATPRRVAVQPQPAAVVAIIVALVMINGSLAGEYNPGGNPAQTLAQVSAARHRGEAIEIRGVCYSACALKLAAGTRVCVSPTSQIGVHEVRRASLPWGYQAGVRDNLWTGFFERMLPPCARDLFGSRHGFDTGRLTMVSGSDMLRACPAIQACAG